ncbi:hypothetical protein BDV36DRAFT_248695, partial [Aspergillus pseudocaelatus]
MLPCYAFDYAKGFQVLTRRSLAYGERGHIMEVNPIDNIRLHRPPRIIRTLSSQKAYILYVYANKLGAPIEQVNAAKGRLRNVLNRELFCEDQFI